jgi:hypothetical protein
MVRAFTISFDFEGKTFLALVSLKTLMENNTVYTVRVHDDSLARIVPEKSLTYTRQKPLCPSSLKHPQALRLFSCINDAVNCHLQAAETR